ncbi:MAG: hypothetical protein CW341_10725 [Bacteroidetes bacterium]|jgi:peptidoglycan hydrolase CwlO-like protein|nr:hypothetical protein [Bacteroidota bacterium]
MENNNQEKEKNPLKKWVIILGALCAVLLFTTLYFGFFAKPVFNTEYTQVTKEKDNLQAELDALLAEHEQIKSEYGELSELLSEKDSTIMANAAEIQKLIASQADYNKIKRQLQRLQNIAQEYVTEIDQLYTENKALKEENTQVKETLAQTQVEKAQLERHKDSLNTKLTGAAVFKAYNIKSNAVYYKAKGDEVETEKASRAEALKTTLTLAENSLLPSGPVNLYCRIAIPETGRVLTPGAGDAYTFVNDGQRLQYTAKTTVDYNNKAQNVTLKWDIRDNDKAVKGRYIVQLFTDNAYLGESYITLK